ncbi:MAG: hypothetical protein Q4G62_00140 [Pseudomonadota bacterium]|nr:hypothetical protein [Pseudomonadota bacterium]
MKPFTRWMVPAVMAAGFGFAGALAPQQAQAQDELSRVIVDIADVIMRGGQPYDRHGGYGPDDRLLVERDRYGQPVYYRRVDNRRSGPPYGNAYGYHRNGNYNQQRTNCDSRGRCAVIYYDPRYDRRGSDYRVYDDYARRYSRGW